MLLARSSSRVRVLKEKMIPRRKSSGRGVPRRCLVKPQQPGQRGVMSAYPLTWETELMQRCFSPKLFMTDSLVVPDESEEPQAWVWRGTPAPSQAGPLQSCRQPGNRPRALAAAAPDWPREQRESGTGLPGMGTEREPSYAWEMKLFTGRNKKSKPAEREEQAAKPGNPSQERRRQDDSCLPIYSRLKSKVNQPRPFPTLCGGTQRRGTEEHPAHPSRWSCSSWHHCSPYVISAQLFVC